MIFFRKDKIDKPDDDLIKITALLIHAAKIDQNYELEEKNIIKRTIIKIIISIIFL